MRESATCRLAGERARGGRAGRRTHDLVGVHPRAHHAHPHLAARQHLLVAIGGDVAGLVGGLELKVLGDEVVGDEHRERPRLGEEAHLRGRGG